MSPATRLSATARSATGFMALALLVGMSALSCTASASVPASADGAALPSLSARTARALFLYENARLRLTHTNNETTLNERGTTYGTFTAPLTAFLKVSAEHVNAVFTIYPHGGSITGRASAHFKIEGHTCYYGGTLAIVHGTGAYQHASGANIGISGTIDRISFALTVKAHGWMKL